MTIEINTINGIEFKANKKTSNYYIKEDGGKFVRVKVAEFKERIEIETKTELEKKKATEKTKNEFEHFVLLETNHKTQIENVESFELSVHSRKYNRNFVYLAESIARTRGVLFALTTNRINGQRAYKFYGNFEDILGTV